MDFATSEAYFHIYSLNFADYGPTVCKICSDCRGVLFNSITIKCELIIIFMVAIVFNV